MSKKPMYEYAVYKGDELICIGTAKECAKSMGILPRSFRFYTTPSYRKRLAKQKNPEKSISVIKLEDTENE